MGLYLKPVDGRTAEEFLEQQGVKVPVECGTGRAPEQCDLIWKFAGANCLPVVLIDNYTFKAALVAYDFLELERACLQKHLQQYEEDTRTRKIYLVKIVDLLPHVERLEARLKERMRAEENHPNKRIGRFAIPIAMLEKGDPFARAILDKVWIVRAEALIYAKEVSYVAYCDLFDEIPLGAMVPDYLWTATPDEEGNIVNLEADRMK